MEVANVEPQALPGEMSVTIGKLAFALSKLQAEIGQPNKTQTAKVPMKSGGSYTYKYADLADCIRVAQPLLEKYEIAVIQTVKTGKGWVSVRTLVAHSSGEFISSSVLLPVGDDKPQSYGSAITYARRYGYCAPLGISPDEDEDGNLAQDSKQGDKPKQGKAKSANDKQGPPVQTIISEKQSKRLFAITTQRGWTNQEVKDLLLRKYGFKSSKEITVLKYDAICQDIEKRTYTECMGHLPPIQPPTPEDIYPDEMPMEEFPTWEG